MRMDRYFIIVGLIGFLTFLLRGAFILPKAGSEVVEKIRPLLEFVPIAVMASIAGIHIAYYQESGQFELAYDKIVAGIIAMIVAYYSKSIALTFAIGMSAIWALGYYDLFQQ